ncbi:GNAT family N-acetyltransferase [Allostreptomyces psammosilenae]|uniref:GNAT superfamily N-acetyltransferase n=1 Tax=Allostreptomyces psammosilenae TaxID=1892865 RepID=A0A852ZX40_9ACTN|nr:GNAT family N-acetyltransferase [Allostreptomyces psammosilenae]NYI06769.1 GNAT superfamily N-acetyltransferase [Allostreptomyces psammosilenae]
MRTTVIERAGRRSAGAITELIHASSAYQGRYASSIAGYRVTPGYVARHLVFRAADAGGRLLGFYALVADPPEAAELDLLFVADHAQGRGLGRRLVDHMLGQARLAGLPGVRVVSHPPAESFYRRTGARRVGTLPAAPSGVDWERPELWWPLGPPPAAEPPPR